MARLRGTEVALTFGGRETTYAELHERSDRCARALCALGVQPGDRVGVLAKDSDTLIEVILGIAKARAVFLGINWRLAEPEVQFILEDSGASVLFAGRELLSLAGRLRDQVASLGEVIALDAPQTKRKVVHDYAALRDTQHVPAQLPHAQPDDIVALLYTSGSTGKPKGVELANRSFFAVMDALARAGDPWIGWHADDVALHSLPSFHIQGLWWAITTLNAGATLAIMEHWVARDALSIIPTERVTKAFFVPAMLQMMLLEPSCASTDFSSVTHLLYGGAPMPPALLSESIRRLACPHIQIYGLTETGNTATCLRAEEHRADSPRLASAGKPYPGVQVKVVDHAGQHLAPGSIGEVCIHSPANMVGYWNRPDATRTTLINGWVHTGDAGYVDDDGYLYICDRIKDMIIYAGENVYPAEVEAALTDHPSVAQIAVIGIPDERWGELVHAVVVPRSGHAPTLSQLHGHASGRLADFKLPRSLELSEALPRTSSGKVKKGELRAARWANVDRKI